MILQKKQIEEYLNQTFCPSVMFHYRPKLVRTVYGLQQWGERVVHFATNIRMCTTGCTLGLKRIEVGADVGAKFRMSINLVVN